MPCCLRQKLIHCLELLNDSKHHFGRRRAHPEAARTQQGASGPQLNPELDRHRDCRPRSRRGARFRRLPPRARAMGRWARWLVERGAARLATRVYSA